MAFESVDAGSLKGAVASCISSINYNNSLTIKGNIGNDNIWNCESRTNLKNALTRLTGTRYKDLRSKLDVANQIADLIIEYKRLEEENVGYRNKISSLQPKLYYEENYISGYSTDDDGNQQEIWSTRTVMNQKIADQIAELNRKIQENEERMNELEQSVSSMVGGM